MIHCECYALRQRAEWKKSEVRSACKIAEVTFQKMIIRTLKIWTLFRSNLFANNSAGIQAFLFFGRKFWSWSTRHWCLQSEQLLAMSRKRWLLLSSKPEKGISTLVWAWKSEEHVKFPYNSLKFIAQEFTNIAHEITENKELYVLIAQVGADDDIIWSLTALSTVLGYTKKRYQSGPRRRWSWL